MKLIVGLGNPGRLYAGSRHNIGFRVIKALSRHCKIELKKDSAMLSFSGQGKAGKEILALATPLTFMNLSGGAVKRLLKKYRLGPESLLVVCDDLDLELGRVRIRGGGSSGGHRGLKSIIEELGSQGFSRLRMGIGRPRGGVEPAEYVLSAFSLKEKAEVADMVTKALDCCLSWLSAGIEPTMNKFNKRSENE